MTKDDKQKLRRELVVAFAGSELSFMPAFDEIKTGCDIYNIAIPEFEDEEEKHLFNIDTQQYVIAKNVVGLADKIIEQVERSEVKDN